MFIYYIMAIYFILFPVLIVFGALKKPVKILNWIRFLKSKIGLGVFLIFLGGV